MAKKPSPKKVIARVVNEVLPPAGFMPAEKILVRACGDQVHGLNVQTMWGQLEYCVNIMFHYRFLASVSTMEHTPLHEYREVDFVLRARLGKFLDGYDAWSSCTPADAKFEARLRQHLEASLDILDDCSNKWSDPAYFLRLAPPAVLAADVPVEGVEPPIPSQNTIPRIWSLLPEWCPDRHDFAYALCQIAMREGQFADAIKYADIALTAELGEHWQWQKDRLRTLRAEAIVARGGRGEDAVASKN